jgi:hypothetical protein
MILYKPEHVVPIILGAKTQTRRLGEARWNVCSVHQARTNMPWQDAAGHFADHRILGVRQERLFDISQSDVLAEGYQTVNEYTAAFHRINRRSAKPAWQWTIVLNPLVWVVEFEVVKVYWTWESWRLPLLWTK